jgi:hypothetical protein
VELAAMVHMLVTVKFVAERALRTVLNVDGSRLAQNAAVVFIGMIKQQPCVVVLLNLV